MQAVELAAERMHAARRASAADSSRSAALDAWRAEFEVLGGTAKGRRLLPPLARHHLDGHHPDVDRPCGGGPNCPLVALDVQHDASPAFAAAQPRHRPHGRSPADAAAPTLPSVAVEPPNVDFSVECPRCYALPGEPCRYYQQSATGLLSRELLRVHAARRLLVAARAARGKASPQSQADG